MPMHPPDSVSLNFPANLIVHSDYIFSINYLIHGTTYDILCEIDHAVSISNSKYRLFQKTIINNILTHTTSPRQSSSKNYILIFVYPSTKKSVVTIQILSHPFLHQFPSCTLLPYDILLFSHIAFLSSECSLFSYMTIPEVGEIAIHQMYRKCVEEIGDRRQYREN